MLDAFWNPGIYYTVSHTQVVIFCTLNSLFYLAALFLQSLAHRRERLERSKFILEHLLVVAQTLSGKAPAVDSTTPPDAGAEPASDVMLDTVADAVANVGSDVRVERRRWRGKKR